MEDAPRYDTIGRDYAQRRRPDPRIAVQIHAALGDARVVANVGAGTGSYEPADRTVIPIEPSAVMSAQRPSHLARAIHATAEALPLNDDSVDAAMAVLTIQHWSDVRRGLRELVRVSRRRVVIVTVDRDVYADAWMFRDYVPPALVERDRDGFPAMSDLREGLGVDIATRPIPVPCDCLDGFMLAYWGRPEGLLDPATRRAHSLFALMDPSEERAIVRALEHDLASGRWEERHGHLRALDELDVGLRIVIAELDRANT